MRRRMLIWPGWWHTIPTEWRDEKWSLLYRQLPEELRGNYEQARMLTDVAYCVKVRGWWTG